jgi:heme-degrading monooxygenase HmoA
MKMIATAACSAALGLAAGIGLQLHHASAEEARPASAASRTGKPAVARAWHGKTPRARADEYERYLAAAIEKFPSIKGNLGYQLMRLDGGPDGEQYTEFQVISYWESLDSIHAYAGKDIRRTHDLPRDDQFLVAKEPFVRNYELEVNALRP